MPVIEDKKSHNIKKIITIVAYLSLLVITIIGIIFFFYWMGLRSQNQTPSDNTPKDEEVIDNTENITKYNRLLKILNDETIVNHFDAATELISFHFDDTNKFYLVGKNDTSIYDYSIDVSSVGTTLEEAVSYLLENDPNTSMTKIFDKYNLQAVPENFSTKYINDNIKHKTVSMNIGTKTYVTSTMYNETNKEVSLIYHQELNVTLDSDYTPVKINKESNCYSLYQYIATK